LALSQAPGKSDVQAIGQERDEDVRLNACLKLVRDRPDRQVALEVLEPSSTATKSR
jgi:hypothetical protein